MKSRIEFYKELRELRLPAQASWIQAGYRTSDQKTYTTIKTLREGISPQYCLYYRSVIINSNGARG